MDKGETRLVEFYDDILKQVIYKIGDLREQNELDISTELICSNITNEIIYKINKSHIKKIENQIFYYVHLMKNFITLYVI